jgi:hypothetical protein
MCGSTGQQQTIQSEQMAQYQQIQQLTAEQYAHQQEIYAPMAAQFKSIFAMGPSQEGFAPGEKQDLDTQVIEGTAQNYSQAARAVNRQIAAGGGGPMMPSGAADELKLDTAVSSAQEQSREESQVKQADYAQGYNEWQQAGAGLTNIAAGENPLGYIGATTSAGGAAADTANQIATQQNSWINAAIGAAGAVGGGLAAHKFG